MTAATDFAAAIGFGSLLFGTTAADFFQAPALAAVGLLALSYAGLGMIVSGIILGCGSGRSLFQLAERLSIILGGVFFPTLLLPPAVARCAGFIPMGNALDTVRYTLLRSPSFWPPLTRLALTALLLLPLGALVLQAGLNRSRQRAWDS